MPPLSLYIHVPWCVQKCPYCDFNSHGIGQQSSDQVIQFFYSKQSLPVAQEIPEERYFQALKSDLEQQLPDFWGRPIYSVFFGGGTPSLLSAETIDRILSMVRSYCQLVPDAEITLEANPGTAEAARFADYVSAGVNRFSLGIQSFDDTLLRRIGRIHDAHQARCAIEMAQKLTHRVNLDIMFGLPGQSLEASKKDIQEALSYGTEHLSLYQFTLEPNTYFATHVPDDLPDDECLFEMQEQAEHLTAAVGMERYEVSAYARGVSARCLHNLNYWSFGDYIGIGPGAHGKISFPNRIMRTVKVSHPERWIQACLQQDGSHVNTHDVTVDDLPFEFMLNALRLKNGVPTHYYQDHTGLPLNTVMKSIDRAVQKGLMSDDPLVIKTTETGWRFLSDVQSLFLEA
ncbi:coproporphyrinogen III oxidase [Basilea psittacipulmonis DSM 24701]|uniref:Heme chaperone HemW n=1 Tax=Basilea psittacipulmonis DSM 24701 TaxID=1072685 RepID=A0A077DCJ8_9BURK|nr:coproporphyrinogen III oxidase [Basilea psittacipulmonis DSM 24701]